MAGRAPAVLDPDHARREIELVVDDHERGGRETSGPRPRPPSPDRALGAEIRDRARRARLVHVGLGTASARVARRVRDLGLGALAPVRRAAPSPCRRATSRTASAPTLCRVPSYSARGCRARPPAGRRASAPSRSRPARRAAKRRRGCLGAACRLSALVRQRPAARLRRPPRRASALGLGLRLDLHARRLADDDRGLVDRRRWSRRPAAAGPTTRSESPISRPETSISIDGRDVARPGLDLQGQHLLVDQSRRRGAPPRPRRRATMRTSAVTISSRRTTWKSTWVTVLAHRVALQLLRDREVRRVPRLEARAGR